jgi:hypothetical protein
MIVTGEGQSTRRTVHHSSHGIEPELLRSETDDLNYGTALSVINGHSQSVEAGLAQSVQWVGQGLDYRGVTVRWLDYRGVTVRWSFVSKKFLSCGHDGLLVHAAS